MIWWLLGAALLVGLIIGFFIGGGVGMKVGYILAIDDVQAGAKKVGDSRKIKPEEPEKPGFEDGFPY